MRKPTQRQFIYSLPPNTKEHPEHPGIWVCSDGRIFSSRFSGGFYEGKWYPMKTHHLKKHPYERITIGGSHVGKITIMKYVHQLVMETHNPTLDESLEIDHIDNDKTNNDLSNLRWLSRGDNVRRRWGR